VTRLVLRGAIGLCVCLGVALGIAPGPCLAETNVKAEARRHHDLGLSCMKKKAYGEAIAELNQAYDLGHDASVLFDIGQAYVAIDQPVFAVRTLKKYLAEGGKQVPGTKRKEAEATLAAQQRRIASVTLHSAVDGAIIRVDGIAVGKTPTSEPLELSAGPHFLSASADGYRLWDLPLDLAGGENRGLEIRLEANDAAPAAPVAATPVAPSTSPAAAGTMSPTTPIRTDTTATTPAAPAPSAFPTKTVAALTLGSLGAAALVVGGIYGVRAITKRQESDRNCPQDQCSQVGINLNDQAKSAALVADISIGVGLVAAAVATYLVLRPAQPSSAPAAPAAPASAAAQGLQLAAGVGPHEATVGLRGAW